MSESGLLLVAPSWAHDNQKAQVNIHINDKCNQSISQQLTHGTVKGYDFIIFKFS